MCLRFGVLSHIFELRFLSLDLFGAWPLRRFAASALGRPGTWQPWRSACSSGPSPVVLSGAARLHRLFFSALGFSPMLWRSARLALSSSGTQPLWCSPLWCLATPSHGICGSWALRRRSLSHSSSYLALDLSVSFLTSLASQSSPYSRWSVCMFQL